EPPHFGAQATLGGTIAAGLSGPRRPYSGAARDFVLGTRILNGRGESLHFGGQVMKNVAGYDLSRLMVGAMGTLGVLLEVSLKVLPRPALEATLVQEIDQAQAIRRMNELAGRPLPLSAAYWEEDRLYLRLSGAGSAVAAAQAKIGGEALDSTNLWQQLRELQTDFLAHATTLWRISLPPATPPLDLPGAAAIDWGGAQRWLAGEADPRIIRAAAESAGGHATLFRGNGQAPRIHPLPDALMGIHRRLKQALDPAGILNPGRLYPDL
ncbi:MAG: glycolate oxidase subunit GlcE, partial [Salinisphaera sp.]|nr:glycolate oxidase subunit GlcE [Salinisphaera sp.]